MVIHNLKQKQKQIYNPQNRYQYECKLIGTKGAIIQVCPCLVELCGNDIPSSERTAAKETEYKEDDDEYSID